MIMAEPTPFPLVVELWYAEAPDLDDTSLLDALRSLSPEAQLQMDSVVVPHGEGPRPLLTVMVARRCPMSAKPGTGTVPKLRSPIAATACW